MKKKGKENNIFIILHNIRSAYNIGSILRTADAVGVDKVFMTGYSPSPLDKYGRVRSDIHKTALGAEKTISWKHVRSLPALLSRLKRDGTTIISVEQTKESIDYRDVVIMGPTVFIFGNEVRGLSQAVLQKSDKVSMIPMCGNKESLNVASAAAVFLFRVLQN